jgi:hypothetical protein
VGRDVGKFFNPEMRPKWWFPTCPRTSKSNISIYICLLPIRTQKESILVDETSEPLGTAKRGSVCRPDERSSSLCCHLMKNSSKETY